MNISVKNLKDIDGLKKALNKCGLDLVAKEYDLDMLVIKDKKSK